MAVRVLSLTTPSYSSPGVSQRDATPHQRRCETILNGILNDRGEDVGVMRPCTNLGDQHVGHTTLGGELLRRFVFSKTSSTPSDGDDDGAIPPRESGHLFLCDVSSPSTPCMVRINGDEIPILILAAARGPGFSTLHCRTISVKKGFKGSRDAIRHGYSRVRTTRAETPYVGVVGFDIPTTGTRMHLVV
ncbi:hypothetical protein BV25DRAFT_448155 [Artomyces pyxidatus]|uniref:Uncharacterized protein n=1 Tax=Artomyces pyxidatus TaxID=48021 RepID=A0ACB8T322_9AGAM|nr:hypothetical protein BV25DRAFT_448155 [Artomyces pyxidatus]